MARTIRDEDDDGRPTTVFEDVEALKATELAVECLIDGEKVWVPQSVIHANSEVSGRGDRGRLVVHEWWAEKKGLV